MGSDESSSALLVRGGTPDQNLILFDDITIFNVDHFLGFFSPFNTDAISNITLYKGGFPAVYDSRASSVMEVTGKSVDINDFKISGELSFLSANALVEIPLWGRGSIHLSGRRSYSDIIESITYKKIFGIFENEKDKWIGTSNFNVTSIPSSHFYDFYSKIIFNATDNDTMKLSLYSGREELNHVENYQVKSYESQIKAEGYDDRDESWGNFATNFSWVKIGLIGI